MYLLTYTIEFPYIKQTQVKHKLYKDPKKALKFVKNYNKEMQDFSRNRGVDRVLTDSNIEWLEVTDFCF